MTSKTAAIRVTILVVDQNNQAKPEKHTIVWNKPIQKGTKPFFDIKVIVKGVDQRYEVEAQD